MGEVTGHREGRQDTGPTLRPKAPSMLSFPLLLADLLVYRGVISRSAGRELWGKKDQPHPLAWPCLEARSR